MTVMLYSPSVSERLRYLATYLFEELWCVSLQITDDQELYTQGNGVGINYSGKSIREEEVLLFPHALLFEKGVQEQGLNSGMHEGVPTCFAAPPGYALPFDPLAASFYLLSRYEEYLPHTADTHARYPAELSWAYRNGALSRPIIWEWLKLLRTAIQRVYPQWTPSRKASDYEFVPTYDIDIPWAYRYRGWRGWVRAAIEAIQLNWRSWQKRIAAWRNPSTDPYFTFPDLEQLHRSSAIRPTIFWLLADRSKHDINPNPAIPAFQQLVQSVALWSDSGLHPSYVGGQSASGITKEKGRLQEVLGETIYRSRQHYLRLSLPNTYRELQKAGITTDYSMGFAAQAGFRAGTTEPFWWYDLEQEQITNLRVYPFAVMDVTLKQYMGLDAAAAKTYLLDLQQYCRQEGLRFCTLWHNSSFSELHGWSGWNTVYWSLFEQKT